MACCTVDDLGCGKVFGVILPVLDDINAISKDGDSRISTVQTVTKTKSPKYAIFCRGNKKGKIWYGRLCDHPSRGWNA